MTFICQDCGETFPLSKFGPKKKIPLCYDCNLTRWKLENAQELKNYRVENKAQIYAQTKKWFSNNKDKRRVYKSLYYKNRKLNDPAFKIKANLRSRIADAVKGKTKSTEILLGCSYDEFISHLESKFYINKITGEAMTLNNYGKWEIDHIRPLKDFDLLNPKELEDACRYTNLQPLWKEDHLVKTAIDLTQV